MAIDKEFLIKHRFWVALAVCLPLPLVAILVLATTVASAISVEQKKVQGRLRDVEGYKNIKGPREVKWKEEEAGQRRQLEAKLWDRAWRSQQDLMTWPAAVEARDLFPDQLFARHVQAARGKEGEGALPAAAANQFLGTVTLVRPDHFKVQGKGAAEKTFRPSADVVLTLTDARARDKRRPLSALRVGDRVLVGYQRDRYFGDELNDVEKKAFRQSYATQLAGVLKELDPVTTAGQGVVLLVDSQSGQDWLYREDADGIPDLPAGATFFTCFPGPWKENRYLSREAWTAQEDLWVQRELFRSIRAVNRRVATFTRKYAAGARPAGPGGADVFVNPYWEVTLKLTPDGKGLTGKVTNPLGRRQRVDGTYLLVRVREQGEPEKVRLGGEPLLPGAGRDLPVHKLQGGAQATGIVGVEQVLTWETAAVKRLDAVLVGGGRRQAGSGSVISALAHRTSASKLVAFPFPRIRQEETPAAGAAKGAAAAKAAVPQTNGFAFERYVEVSRQVRRLPVALSLIVDQQYVGLVQPAFANGRLRFRTMQVIWHRYPHRLRPHLDTLAVAAGVPPKGPPPGLPDWARPGGSPGALGPTPGLPFGAPPGPAPAFEESATNVEMVLYGVVSLYQRYPPRGQEGTNP
jgi:hypothetical protein